MPYQPYQPTWNNPYLAQSPYQPVMQQQTMPVQYQTTAQGTNGITQVNGPDSAMQYVMGPNSTSPALFDSNGKVFYVVSTDGTGTKSLETFDYSPRADAEPVVIDGVEFASKKEFDELAAKVSVLTEVINGSHAAVSEQPAAATARHSAGSAAE